MKSALELQLAHTRKWAKRIKKQVAMEWGGGWNKLSPREQKLELAEAFANIVLGQVFPDPQVKELQDLARTLLKEES